MEERGKDKKQDKGSQKRKGRPEVRENEKLGRIKGKRKEDATKGGRKAG